MKSRFAFGMFAGFALACLFFFFFLYFYPSAFRAQAAKNLPPDGLIAYYQVYDESPAVEYGSPYMASTPYYGAAPAAEHPYGPEIVPAPPITPEVPAYELPKAAPAGYNAPPATPEAPNSEPYISAM